MDLQTPVMDDIQVTREINSKELSPTVIALTASALIENQQQAANADMINFISKSFKSEELSQKTLKYI